MARRTKVSRASTRDNARAMMEIAGAGAAGFADTFLAGVSTRIRDETELLMGKMEERVLVMRDRFMFGTYFAILLGVASVFLIVALLLYMVQAGMSWATSFLVGGILILIAAFVFYYLQRR